MESLELGSVRVVLEVRPQYLLVTERGAFESKAMVARYLGALEATARREGLRSVLVDARLGALDDRPANVRDAIRDALFSGQVFEKVALVLSGDVAAAELTTAALAHSGRAGAFTTVRAAHQWLLGSARGAVQIVSALAVPIAMAPTERPPSRPGIRAPSAGSEERVGTETSRGATPPRRGEGTSSGVVPRTSVHDAPAARPDKQRGER